MNSSVFEKKKCVCKKLLVPAVIIIVVFLPVWKRFNKQRNDAYTCVGAASSNFPMINPS